MLTRYILGCEVVISRDVYAFVDWDTSRRCSWLGPVSASRMRRRGVAAQLTAVYEILGHTIAELYSGTIRVRPRLYHGWHQGNEPTVDRRALIGVDPGRRVIGKVLLDPPTIADTLACGMQLRDTLRRRDDGLYEQKMVDTALCTDLLWFARSESTRRDNVAFIVMSEDDDMLPAVLAAECWGVSVKVVRLRDAIRTMPHTRSCIHLLPDWDKE